MIILGIESSCDETAAAVLQDGHDLLSNVINSQIAVHSPYGGVVPELASRKHIENIGPVVQQALDTADLKLTAVDGIAVTRGPGLIGSLLVGLSFAKALSYVNRIPCVGVDHMAGHLASVMFSKEKPIFPAIALVVSGGHSNLYRLESLNDYQLIGRSRDDAAGEAFDKAAKLLGLGYPGGPVVSRLAASGNSNAIPFPRAWLEPGSYDFSFSGLKTALALHIRKMAEKPDDTALANICASYQEAVIEVLSVKTIAAAKDHHCRQIMAAGGVASNPRLRMKLEQLALENDIALSIPDREFCTDNAAMIAMAGNARFAKEGAIDLDMDVYSRTDH